MRTLVVLLGLIVLAPAALPPDPVSAQDWRRRGRRTPAARMDPGPEYDGRLTFVRIRYEPRKMWNWSDGYPGWGHDYPTAERNFMQILGEITASRVYAGGSRVIELDDPALFKYPIIYISEPGDWTASEEEAAALRTYMAKGGFVIFDDFPGRDWRLFDQTMRTVIPDVEYIRLGLEHPVFHTFFEIESLDMLQGSYRGGPVFFGIFEDNNPSKRLVAVVNYNTDIGEFWQYSATGFVPVDVSNDAYKLGVNYWLYALTH